MSEIRLVIFLVICLVIFLSKTLILKREYENTNHSRHFDRCLICSISLGTISIKTQKHRQPVKNLITPKIKKFINTKEGNEVFKKLSGSTNCQMTSDRKKAFTNPPANVLRWLKILYGIEKYISKK